MNLFKITSFETKVKSLCARAKYDVATTDLMLSILRYMETCQQLAVYNLRGELRRCKYISKFADILYGGSLAHVLKLALPPACQSKHNILKIIDHGIASEVIKICTEHQQEPDNIPILIYLTIHHTELLKVRKLYMSYNGIEYPIPYSAIKYRSRIKIADLTKLFDRTGLIECCHMARSVVIAYWDKNVEMLESQLERVNTPRLYPFNAITNVGTLVRAYEGIDLPQSLPTMRQTWHGIYAFKDSVIIITFSKEVIVISPYNVQPDKVKIEQTLRTANLLANINYYEGAFS